VRRSLLALGVFAFCGGCVQRVVAEDPTEFGTTLAGSSTSTGSVDDTSTSSESSSGPIPATDGPECLEPIDCPDNATCFEGVCVGAGELRISLSWSYVSDLDLHVETPSGVHIFFENPSEGGGILDVDDCIGGQCVDNTATHVENVYFPQQPPLGEYRVWVYNFDGLAGGTFDIEVSGEASAAFEGEMPASPVQSEVFTFSL